MNQFNDQENQQNDFNQNDFNLGSRLQQQTKKLQTTRIVLTLVLVISMVVIWLMNWDEHTDVLTALSLFIGALAGIHIIARWQSPLIAQAAKRLQNR